MMRFYDHDDMKVKLIMNVKHFEKVKVIMNITIKGFGMNQQVQKKKKLASVYMIKRMQYNFNNCILYIILITMII